MLLLRNSLLRRYLCSSAPNNYFFTLIVKVPCIFQVTLLKTLDHPNVLKFIGILYKNKVLSFIAGNKVSLFLFCFLVFLLCVFPYHLNLAFLISAMFTIILSLHYIIILLHLFLLRVHIILTLLPLSSLQCLPPHTII